MDLSQIQKGPVLLLASLLALSALVLPAGAQSDYATPYTFSTLNFDGSPVGVFYPEGVAVDTNGNVYVSATDNSTIEELSPVGTNWVVTTLAGQAGNPGTNDGVGTNAQFNFPIGVAVDSKGNIYVADTQNATIRKVAPTGSNWVVTTLAGLAGNRGDVDATNSDARFEDPYGVAVDAAGNLYVADPGGAGIREVTPVGTNWVVTTLAGTPAAFRQPAGVAVDDKGILYVADQENNTISQVAPQGTNWVVTVLAGQGIDFNPPPQSADGTGTNAQFDMPIGVAVDSAHNLYVADNQNDEIRKVTQVGSNWVVTTLAGLAGVPGSTDGTGSNALFNLPSGVAVNSAGILFVADSANNVIRSGTNSFPPDQFLLYGGLTNTALGQATLTLSNNQLILGNLGASGQDGVSIDLPNYLTSLEVHFEPLDASNTLPIGAFIEVGDTTSDSTTNVVATIMVTKVADPTYVLSADFSKIGATSYNVLAYSNCVLVGEADNLTVTNLAVLSAMPGSVDDEPTGPTVDSGSNYISAVLGTSTAPVLCNQISVQPGNVPFVNAPKAKQVTASQVAFITITSVTFSPLTINLSQAGRNLTLQWFGTGSLQNSSDLENWSDVTGATSPYATTIGDINQFFRISQPNTQPCDF
jgi:sugar lactone lactonase YvrE